MIYLDHNATTPLVPEARAAICEALDAFGNPSSVHAAGRRARDLVERARAEVAALLGAAADEIVFTSGGTEANNLALRGCGRVVTTAVEHPSVLEACDESVRVPVSSDGIVDLDLLARALRGGGAGGAVLASVQWANHETGVVQPLCDVAAACREARVPLHVDAVQAAGRVAVDVARAGCDLLSISAHKIGGPAGVGALWVRRGADPPALLKGGKQERGRRAGTENVVGIAGFGAAAAAARRDLPARGERVARLSRRLEDALLALPGARLIGARDRRVPGTVNVAFHGAGGEAPAGEAIVEALDLEGVCVSTGAACASGSIEPSPVLLAMGLLPEAARSAVRLSPGAGNTREEIDRVVAIFPSLLERVRRFEPRLAR